MRNKILFVDPSPQWQQLVTATVGRQTLGIDPIVAVSGQDAAKVIASTDVCAVVCDKRLPDMEADQWFGHLRHLYPDIAVIMAAESIDPTDRRNAAALGVTRCFDKSQPLTVLVQMIREIAESETEGGSLQTIPLETFVQVIEMEQKTCTIRVINEAGGSKGVLFFQNGELIDARLGRLRGKPAAYSIFSWEKVLLCIQNSCAVKTNRINEYLQAFLMNAIARKDEAVNAAMEQRRVDAHAAAKPTDQDPGRLSLEALRARIRHVSPGAIEDIYIDSAWNPLIEQARRLGAFFAAGQLRACFLQDGKSLPLVLIPGTRTAVVSVQPDACRDVILNAVTD